MSPSIAVHVPETRFGKWFLKTETWRVHVLERAMADLVRLIPERRASYDVVVDVGCGSGYSLPKLAQRFAPRELIGVDIDPQMLQAAREEATRAGIAPRLTEASSSRMPLPDASADMLFCHQTFHHLVEQEEALAEFLRVLKPGGILLFAESTRRYIHSWIIRALFRHPMDVQRSAPELAPLNTFHPRPHQLGGQLHAVADPEHGDAQLKNLWIHRRRARVVHARWTAREDDALRLQRGDLLRRGPRRDQVRIRPRLAHAPGDELRGPSRSRG